MSRDSGAYNSEDQLSRFIAQDVIMGSPFADWAELCGRIAKERDDALAELANVKKANGRFLRAVALATDDYLAPERLSAAMQSCRGVNWPPSWGPEDFAWLARQIAAKLRETA